LFIYHTRSWKRDHRLHQSHQTSSYLTVREKKYGLIPAEEECSMLNYLSDFITTDAWCTREVKSRIHKRIQQEEDFFTCKLDLNSREKLVQMLRLEYSILWCWKFDTLKTRSETPGKFWNVVLEKDGEDQLDW
jgi:hypothetical protein